jgi:hypothetical protein
MKQMIGGYSLDLLTSDEVRGHLDNLHNLYMRDAYRGISYLSFTEITNALEPGQIVFPGPESGYAWSIKQVSVQIDDTAPPPVSVYLGENLKTPPIATGTAMPGVGAPFEFTYHWTSNIVVLLDNRVIMIATPAGSVITSARLYVKQCVAEMVAKL